MNRTLVELSRAMIIANDLPEFLWEYAVLHAAYLRNRSFTKHLPKSMPYEGWHNNRPNVSHLHELGHLYGFYYRDRKSIRRCNLNQNGEFMLVLMMVLGL